MLLLLLLSSTTNFVTSFPPDIHHCKKGLKDGSTWLAPIVRHPWSNGCGHDKVTFHAFNSSPHRQGQDMI